MILGESSTFDEFLEKVNQFRLLGTPTNFFPLQFIELSNKQIKDYDSSWIKMMLK